MCEDATSRLIGCLVLSVALGGTLAPPAVADVQVQFNQSSDPPALITSSTTVVATGMVVSTVAAPMTSGAYQFTYWTFNGLRQQDPLGRGINPITFTIVEPVDAIAHYVLATTDTEGAGVPDYFKLQYYDATSIAATSDTDSDGFTLLNEYIRDTHPNLVDTVSDGGISQRSSALTLVIQATNIVVFQMTSAPPGIIGTNQPVVIGTAQILPDLNATYFGYQFAEWTVNGVRVADALGRSVGNLGVVISSNTTATAVFLSPTTSSLNDGVPDWFKLQFYGMTSISATSDSDGDGFTLLDEYTRDTHPNLKDAISDGGISCRASELIGFRNPGYVWYIEQSSPPGFIDTELILPTNTVRTLPDISTSGTAAGYAFAEWRTNGVRVADALGRSIGGLTILINTDTTATAVFLPLNQQSAADDVADWFKMQFYGTTNMAATSDTDGDGCALLDEYWRDYNPTVVDTIVDGGISQRSSPLIYVYIPYFYRINSSPTNILATITDYVPYGTKITTTNAPLSSGGYSFGHWEVGGVRQQDPSGYSLNPVPFNVYFNMTVTAFYYPTTADSNGNGLPDWWEDYWFGGPTNANATADSDGDGLTNLEEYLGGSNPLVADRRVLSVDWLGGIGNWSDTTKWSTGIVPNDALPTNFVVYIDHGRSANSIVTQDMSAAIERLILDAGETLRLLPGVVLTFHKRPTSGAVTNAGLIALNDSELRFANGTGTLTGGGVIEMSDSANNIIRAASTNLWLYNLDNTIRGSGNIGSNNLGIVNNGTIIANQTTPLVLDPADTLGFTNTGTIQVNDGSTLVIQGPGFIQTAGTMRINGTLIASNGLNIAGGLLTGSGTNFANISNNGTLAPGVLTVIGNLTQRSNATLSVAIGGYGFGAVSVSSTATFAGRLTVALTNNFGQVVTNGASFTVLTASVIAGAFTNVASGGTLVSTDGTVWFTVQYGGSNLILSVQTTDSDSDGMPNWWEDLYGFNKTDPTDAALDADSDGMTNLQEYLAGTDPRNPLSRLAITDIRRIAGDYQITFSAVSGKVYRVEYNSDLRLTNGWQVLGGYFEASNSVIQVIDPTATNVTNRFYRVRLKP